MSKMNERAMTGQIKIHPMEHRIAPPGIFLGLAFFVYFDRDGTVFGRLSRQNTGFAVIPEPWMIDSAFMRVAEDLQSRNHKGQAGQTLSFHPVVYTQDDDPFIVGLCFEGLKWTP